MPLADSVARLASTSITLLRSRLELASIDIEDELRSMIGVVLAGSAVVILAAFAMLFAAFAMVALYWETHRVTALVVAGSTFAILAIGFALWIRRFLGAKPPVMAATIAELDRDRQRMESFP
ncbi:MAG: phage holin family protein [Casimicrobium sp.]